MTKTVASAIEWSDLAAEASDRTTSPTSCRVLLPEAIYDEILRQTQHDLARECAGLPFGEWTLRGDLATRIVAAPAALALTASLTHVVVHAEAWPAVWRSLPPGNRAGELVGWYHSHPGHGAFLSSTDRVTQATWFRRPWHIALVVDPIRSEVAAFHGPGGDRAVLELVPHSWIPARGEG